MELSNAQFLAVLFLTLGILCGGLCVLCGVVVLSESYDRHIVGGIITLVVGIALISFAIHSRNVYVAIEKTEIVPIMSVYSVNDWVEENTTEPYGKRVKFKGEWSFHTTLYSSEKCFRDIMNLKPLEVVGDGSN